jgi:hypothetical protein
MFLSIPFAPPAYSGELDFSRVLFLWNPSDLRQHSNPFFQSIYDVKFFLLIFNRDP